MIRYHDVNKRKPSDITEKEEEYIRNRLNCALEKWDWLGEGGFQDENQRKVVNNVINNLKEQLDEAKCGFKTLHIFNSICSDFTNDCFKQSDVVDLTPIQDAFGDKLDKRTLDILQKDLKNR